jgi:hypothetical protein
MLIMLLPRLGQLRKHARTAVRSVKLPLRLWWYWCKYPEAEERKFASFDLLRRNANLGFQERN